MIADLKPYPAMKDSGVEWLGEVPGHWEVRQLGRIGRFLKGRGGTKEDEIDVGVPCVRYGDLYTQHGFFIEKTKACVSESRATEYTPIQYGDVLFAGSGETIEEIGKSAVNLLSEPVCCGGDVIIFRPSVAVDAKFLGLAADCPQTAHQKSCMGRGITVMHIYGDKLKYMSIPVPPPPEQAAIVKYLNYVDRRVRRLVRAKRKLIALLTEQKQAIIHRAVTRGLDPDVPLKDSGVEWLGQVPEHWDILSIRRITTRHKQGYYTKQAYVDTGVRLVRITDIEETRINWNRMPCVSISAVDEESFCVVEDDFLFARTGGAGSFARAISPLRSVFASYLINFRFDNRVAADYIEFYLQAPSFKDGIQRSIHGGVNKNVHAEDIKNQYIPIPPSAEQIAILNHLRIATADIDKAITSANREIDLLNEYRTRLIADVVTGKLDVREAAAALPELDPLDADEPDDALDTVSETELDELDAICEKAEV